jgi:hypothetical protein
MSNLIIFIQDQIQTFLQGYITLEKAINLTNLLLAFLGTFLIAKSTLLKLDPATVIKLSGTYVGGNINLMSNFIDLKIDTVSSFLFIFLGSSLEFLFLIFDYNFFGIKSLQIWFLIIAWFVILLVLIFAYKIYNTLFKKQVNLKAFKEDFIRCYRTIKSICENIKNESSSNTEYVTNARTELTKYYNNLSNQCTRMKIIKHESPLQNIKSFMELALTNVELDIAECWSSYINIDEI